MATRYKGQFHAPARPGIRGVNTGGGKFKASQGRKAPNGRTSSGAPRAQWPKK